MWKTPSSLGTAIASLIESSPPFHGVAVTMTGELADCFATRAVGVGAILEQVTSILPSPMVRVYSVDGTWHSPSQAARDPWKAAASNWHALAQWASRWTTSLPSLLIDVGSTTSDIIKLDREGPCTCSQTDSQRLISGELVYTGVERSNVAGLVHQVPLFGKRCPVMNETFATTRDVYMWLELLAEAGGDCETADGQPATRDHARYRLARIIGEDGSTLTETELDAIAEHVFEVQSQLIRTAIDRVLSSASPSAKKKKKTVSRFEPQSIIVSGHGDFLIEKAIEGKLDHLPMVRLTERLGTELSRVAPAFAVATLASEMME